MEFTTLREALKGRYVLDRELGRGGMGVVFLARDVALERPVAIKLLSPTLSSIPGLRQRFLAEARTAARLSHPNIIPVHSVEEAGTLVWFVMGYVAGETLAQQVRRDGPLPARDVTRLVQEVAWALAYAHQHGVIHRDVKPENILRERGSGRAMVADFGIARVADEPGASPQGELMGTPRMVSPEQASGEPLDGRSDLYSLGVTAFYALTGRYPFEGDNVGQLLAQHLTIPAPPVASLRGGLPAPLALAVDRCLAKSPDERYADGEALAAAVGAAHPAPVPRILSQLTRELSSLGVDIISFDSLVVVAVVTMVLTPDFFGFTYVYTVALGLALAAIAGIRGISLARLVREATREGWTQDDLAAAVQQDAREAEERGPPPPLGKRIALYGAGMAAMLLFWLGPKQWGLGHADTLPGLIIELLALGGPVALGRWLGTALEAPRSGRPGLLTRFFLRFKAGMFFRLLGARKPEAASALLPASDQPTAVLLAHQARELIKGLPAEDREGLAGLSGAVVRLEADADRLRQRLALLDGALSEVGHGAPQRAAASAEIEAERTLVRRQLAETVSALETIRLDLLRLRAGVADRGGLTRSLDQIRQLSAGVDALLASRE